MVAGTDVFDGDELGYFHSYQPARVAVNPLGVRLIKFSVVKNPGPVNKFSQECCYYLLLYGK